MVLAVTKTVMTIEYTCNGIVPYMHTFIIVVSKEC
jgi:hypothetical protein